MIVIGIIEDTLNDQFLLQSKLEKWSLKKEVPVEILTYQSGESFFKIHKNLEISADLSFDIIFIDIQLPKMNGLSVAKKLRSMQYSEKIVFLTGFSDYVFKGYLVDALSYEMKPISFSALERCMNRVFEDKYSQFFSFLFRSSIFQVPYSSILYFNSYDHYIYVYTTTEEYTLREKFQLILQRVPPNFCQCHRSILVNLHHVRQLNKNQLLLSNDAAIPISRSHMENVKRHLLKTVL